MKKNKGFTLIELLAIIVILAIIAVITVPIILNIIDNSKRGAVKDSAYGYKDAVNKYYVSRLSEDKDYTIPDATYTVTATGTLSDGANTLEVTASGQMPGNNSWVTIENNKVISGCLQFDEYKVDITNGQLGEEVKGTCTTGESTGGSSSSVSTIPTCPNCEFAFLNSNVRIGGSYEGIPSSSLTDDYNTVVEATGKNIFMGITHISGVYQALGWDIEEEQIERVFACGLYGSEKTPFCLEGTTDGSKHQDNIDTLTSLFPNDACSTISSGFQCVIDTDDEEYLEQYIVQTGSDGYVNIWYNYFNYNTFEEIDYSCVYSKGAMTCSQNN